MMTTFPRPMRWLLAVILLTGSLGFQSTNLAHATQHEACEEIPLDPDYEGYSAPTVRVCLQIDGGSLNLAGVIEVGATFESVSGPEQAARSVKFSLNDEPLLSDFNSPFEFKWETRRWPDGKHRLSATAMLRSGETVTAASSVTLANHGNPPPQAEPFIVPSAEAPGSDQPVVIAAVGDGPDGSPGAMAVGELIESLDPSLLIYLGDVYDDGLPDEFDNWYEQSLGSLRDITLPALGNHEIEDGEATGFVNYWGDPPLYFATDAGNWRVIVIDSSSSSVQLQPGSAQYEWLAAELAAHPNSCTIVSMHHPAFSIGPHGDTERLQAVWNLIAGYGVEIVLTGHDHDYQRWEPLDGTGAPSPSGTTQFVVGTGGHGIRPFERIDDRVALGIDETGIYGAVRLKLYANRAEFAFLSTSGQSLDKGKIRCDAGA